MLKKHNRILFAVLTVMLAVISLCGCSGSKGNGGGKTVNEAYVIKEKDFSEFESNMLPGKKLTGKYTVPSVEELTVGESYYVVAYTVAETLDGSTVEFSDNGFLEIKEVASGISADEAFEVTDFGGVGAEGVTVKLSNEGDDTGSLNYNVSVTATEQSAEFITYVKFTAKAGGELAVKYYVNGTVKRGEYGLSTNTANIRSKLTYPDKILLSELSVSYLESDKYVDGRYDKTSLLDSVEMSVGKNYYMVVSAKIKSLLTVKESGNVTLNVRLAPYTVIDCTLEVAVSGSADETVDKTVKNISATFKIPEASEGDKEVTFIIKLTPAAVGEAKASVTFTANEVSILGTSRMEKTLVSTQNAIVSEGFSYTLSNNGSYYTLVDVGTAKGAHFLIPSEYKGLPVKEIAPYAFEKIDTLKTVEISEGIEAVGDRAFDSCTSLTSVKLPGTAKVGSGVLKGCESVSSLTVNLDNIKLSSLFGADGSVPQSLKTVTLSGGKALCDNAFSGGTGIETIALPTTINKVGSSAFSGCTSLSSLSVDSQCQSFYVRCGILYEKGTNKIIGSVSKFSGQLTYPDGITEIPGGDMAAVTHITVPGSVTKFSGEVKNLAPREMTGPYFLFTHITGNDNLIKAVMTSGDTVPGTLSGADRLKSVTLPETVTKIPLGALSYCKSLTDINIPDAVEEIGNVAFRGCKVLTSIRLPESLSSMGDWVFQDCERLTSVTLPKNIVKLPEGTFSGCKMLSEISLPSEVKSIGESAFKGCVSLASVSVPSGVEDVCDNAFSGCTRLTSISLPDTVKNINNGAFSDCGLTEFCVPRSAEKVSMSAFSGCKKLYAITVNGESESFYAENGILYNKKTNLEWVVPEGRPKR